GVMMQGGPKKGKDLVAQILKRAEQGSAKMQEETGKPDAEKPLFVGTGYRLGSDVVPSEPVGNTKVGAGDATETAVRELTFWRDGFSVGDGALLRYDDPANSELLNHINSGRAPPSLLNIQYGQPVEVRVTRRINEDYVPPPKAPLKPFEGTGTRL
ncbi:SEP-domain-containing protein, partial [Caulochytrium protostelioides]